MNTLLASHGSTAAVDQGKYNGFVFPKLLSLAVLTVMN